jgi:hypothetical protein
MERPVAVGLREHWMTWLAIFDIKYRQTTVEQQRKALQAGRSQLE